MSFVFEFASDSLAQFKKGDVVDVFEDSRIFQEPQRKNKNRAKDQAETKMPRTNYVHLTDAPVDVTIADARQFLEVVYDTPINPEDPHSGGVKHDRRWYFKNLPEGRKNQTMTWAEGMAELHDHETDLSAAETQALNQ